jgi:hypothetical protein
LQNSRFLILHVACPALILFHLRFYEICAYIDDVLHMAFASNYSDFNNIVRFLSPISDSVAKMKEVLSPREHKFPFMIFQPRVVEVYENCRKRLHVRRSEDLQGVIECSLRRSVNNRTLIRQEFVKLALHNSGDLLRRRVPIQFLYGGKFCKGPGLNVLVNVPYTQ